MRRRRPGKLRRVPITVAKRLANELGMSQVAIVAWDRDTGLTHVVTYGQSVTDCEQAAHLGNLIKRNILGWPEEKCTVPARVRRRDRRRAGPKTQAPGDIRTEHPTDPVDLDYASRGR